MTTTELNPTCVPGHSSSLPLPKPLELEKPYVAPTPPNTHALSVEEGLLASLVDNLTLEDRMKGMSQEHDIKDPFTGGHGADDSHPAPPPHGGLERLAIADGIDSVRLDAAVDLPDLPKPAHQSILRTDEGLPPSAEIGGQGAATSASQRSEHPSTPTRDRVDDLFSLSGLPTLQTFIPDDLFPDDLLVYDPDNIIGLRRCKSRSPCNVPIRYVRVFPNLKAPREPLPPFYLDLYPETKSVCEPCMPPQPALLNRPPNEPSHVAHLYLKAANGLGTGNHSSVFSAPLRLRLNPASGEETTVRVAAKTAHGSCGAHKMLHLEAGVYDAFPRYLMDDQFAFGPQPAAAKTAAPSDDTAQPVLDLSANFDSAAPSVPSPTRTDDKDTVAERWRVEPAVVPKFYGYYAAVAPDGSIITPMHLNCSLETTCSVSWPTRILLVEESGSPIFQEFFTQEQKYVSCRTVPHTVHSMLTNVPVLPRLNCMQLVKRLHVAGFMQNSMYARNVLVQPGPLSAPPSVRSYATPSFRIIDFGRAVALSHLPARAYDLFSLLCEEEEWRAVHHALRLCRAAGWSKSECARRAERPRVDALLCWTYEGLISLHWSELERRWILN